VRCGDCAHRSAPRMGEADTVAALTCRRAAQSFGWTNKRH
jgi:hypothetical protein